MPTPSIQTLVTDAQQVLNLDSISAVRSVVAVALANANTGTPLNPNLTTQQLWNEFYQVVNKPKSDIESIIANQLMKLLYAPPAPGGVGANGQVIFNDNGVLAGDSGLTFNPATDTLRAGLLIVPGNTQLATVGILYVGSLGSPKLKVDVAGTGETTIASATITGAATVGTTLGVTGQSTLTGNVGVGVTPTAWGVGTKALQVGSTAFGSLFDFLTDFVAVTANLHWTGANYGRMSASSKFATAYYQEIATGAHQWLSSTAAGTNVVAPTMVANMTLTAAGNLSLANGDFVVSNGKGIDFSATPGTGTSELLNDYEEGTWAGTLIGGTTNPTVPVTATGKYTKIGRQVTIVIYFNNVSTVGASGVVAITGLPFTEDGGRAVGTVALHTFDFDSGTSVYADVSGSTLFFTSQLTNAAWRDVKHNAGTGRYLRTTVTYNV